ncbi:MAG: hypothetical protein ACP5L2_02985 [Conexivisphaera sp.]|jgi:hypothetical protein
MSEIACAVRLIAPAPPRRWPHIYELRSVNLSLLPEQEARAVLENFAATLNALTAPAEIRVAEDRCAVVLGNKLYVISYKRFFVASQEPLEDVLSVAGLKVREGPLGAGAQAHCGRAALRGERGRDVRARLHAHGARAVVARGLADGSLPLPARGPHLPPPAGGRAR